MVEIVADGPIGSPADFMQIGGCGLPSIRSQPYVLTLARAPIACRVPGGIRSPLVTLGQKFHDRLRGALTQAHCLGDEAAATQSKSGSSSTGWPSRQLQLQGHLFDSGLINQALEIIEKRGGDFEITAFSVQPNDQRGEFSFNFKRTSSVALKVMAVNTEGLDDITSRLQQLVNVIESAEGSLTVMQTKTA